MFEILGPKMSCLNLAAAQNQLMVQTKSIEEKRTRIATMSKVMHHVNCSQGCGYVYQPVTFQNGRGSHIYIYIHIKNSIYLYIYI